MLRPSSVQTKIFGAADCGDGRTGGRHALRSARQLGQTADQGCKVAALAVSDVVGYTATQIEEDPRLKQTLLNIMN
jgi:hypothetical protein